MTELASQAAPVHEAAQSDARPAAPAVSRGGRFRVFLFFSSAFLLTGVVSLLFADLLWRTGWSASRTVLLILFILLFLFMAIGCMNGVFGFIMRRIGDHQRITALGDYHSRDISGTSTAIVFPVYNEDAVRVYEGLRATYESLEKTELIGRFDFFILSDSTDPDKWVDEERRWYDVVRELGALGRIYYRRRSVNEGRKSGNIRDFLNSWGKRYRYFIVFDADSVMRGQTIVDLVKMMEAHPEVGLIQTVPSLVNAESLFGRMQQFANHCYAPIFITGLNYWSQDVGNYWGHNAIIRTEPFMHYCDLPHLPGRKPFGGAILSHDFVEAALLARANWQVWLAYDLPGSYEEGPQGLIENAERDRRWCQGNMQHGLVLFARGLRGITRMHLLQGIFGYLSGPLWLLFLLTFNWMWGFQKLSGLSDITVHSYWMSNFNLTGSEHALLIFAICMIVVMLPKFLSLVDIALDRERRRAFGGLARTVAGAVGETIFSTLHAPLQMLWHTRFVITILLGKGVHWGPQKRSADGTAWTTAIQRHWGHTAIGLAWGSVVWWLDPATFWWFVPVFAGMVLAIPLSVYTSRSRLGGEARHLGLFLTPEETAPPPELDTLRTRLALQAAHGETVAPQGSGLTEVVLDPYINAIHVSLLREKKLNPEYAAAMARLGAGTPQVRALGEKLLNEGPDALQPAEKMSIMTDPDVMSWLHRQVWLRPGDSLAAWWQAGVRQYSR